MGLYTNENAMTALTVDAVHQQPASAGAQLRGVGHRLLVPHLHSFLPVMFPKLKISVKYKCNPTCYIHVNPSARFQSLKGEKFSYFTIMLQQIPYK